MTSCIPVKKFLNMDDLQGQMTMFWKRSFYLTGWIQLCVKNNLTSFDCCDKILLNSS